VQQAKWISFFKELMPLIELLYNAACEKLSTLACNICRYLAKTHWACDPLAQGMMTKQCNGATACSVHGDNAG